LVTVVGSGMKAFHFPDLGEGLHEAQVVEWHVAEGDEVAADDPLLSVETDKAVTEVPAPWKGRIAKLCAAVGDTSMSAMRWCAMKARNWPSRPQRQCSESVQCQPKRQRSLPLPQGGCALCRRYASLPRSSVWTLQE
jgi:Biotin-requiring enzyme